MWFNDPWPEDPRLDPFRDAVWELSREGDVLAHMTMQVSRMRSFPGLFAKQERLWYQIHWADGRRDRIQEDYGPEWYAVLELEQGTFIPDGTDQLPLDARPIGGHDRDALWEKYGPPT